MAKRSEFKCYFGCVCDGSMHRFPSWEYPQTERFNQWKSVLDPATQDKGNNYIYNNIRLCYRHFEDYFQSKQSHRLTTNAIPTLNLVRCEQQRANVNQAQTISTMQSNQQPMGKHINQPSIPCTSTGLQNSVQADQDQVLVQPASTSIAPQNIEQTDMTPLQICKQPSTSTAPPNIVSITESSVRHGPHKAHPQGKKPLTRAICTKRMSNYEQSKLKLQEKVKKLRSKCNTLRKQIITAKKLSKSKSFLKFVDKLPNPIQKFTKMQMQYKKKPRGRRFSTEEKILALTIFKQGPKVYKILKSMFVLPSKRTLQNLLNAITFKPGINKNIFNNLKDTVSKLPQEKKLVNLLFDEVSLAPGVEYNSHNDEVIGFEDFGNGEKKKKLADHALVFMIKGIKGKTKQPVCFTFCESTTKKHDLKNLLITIVKELRQTGLNVICTVCDQAATNVSVIKSLQEDTRVKYIKEGKEFKSKAFEIDDIKVYPLFDSPHLLKGVRNNLLVKNAKFEQNGKIKYAKWEHLQLLLSVDEGDDEIRLVNKLTENHVNKDKIPKMKVKFAAQVFSQRVSAAMRFLAKRNILPAECEDTADFLLIFDKLFDSFNGHSYQPDSKIYKSCLKNNSIHFKLWTELLPILESIKFQSIQKNNGIEVIKNESIPSIKNWIHNIKCFIEMWDDLKTNHNVHNLLTRNFNQDPLENFFSSIRSNGVRNTNPTCNQFISAYKTLIINNFNSPHSPGANCEKDHDYCMQSIQKLISENCDDTQPDYTCEVDSLINVISEIKNSDSELHVESKKYVTGYMIKKCKSKIFKNCQVCNADFIRSEIDVDSFNYEADYTKKSLFHPSEGLIDLMNNVYNVIVACLREFPQTNFLKQKISLHIDFACDFNTISCVIHKADLIDFIKKISMNILIYSWCNGVNRILNGKFLKYDEKDVIKKQAYAIYMKRKKK